MASIAVSIYWKAVSLGLSYSSKGQFPLINSWIILMTLKSELNSLKKLILLPKVMNR